MKEGVRMETTKIKTEVDIDLTGRKVQALVDEIEYEQLKKDRLELQNKLDSVECSLKKAHFIVSSSLEDDNLAEYCEIDTFEKVARKANEIMGSSDRFLAICSLIQEAYEMAMALDIANEYIFECKKNLKNKF